MGAPLSLMYARPKSMRPATFPAPDRYLSPICGRASKRCPRSVSSWRIAAALTAFSPIKQLNSCVAADIGPSAWREASRTGKPRVCPSRATGCRCEEPMTEVNTGTLRVWLIERRPVTVLDVRSQEDREQWSIPGSVHVNAYEAL